MSNDTNTPTTNPPVAKKAKRPKGTQRIEFTEEAIAALPDGKTHMDWWYDTKQPYLIARKVKNRVPEYLYRFTPGQRAANKAMLGTRVAVTQRLGRGISLANARKMAEDLWLEMQALEGRWRRSQGEIPVGHQLSPEPLDMNQPPVENPDYEKLMTTLMDAYQQATEGKGKERHARGLHFEDQDMLQLLRRAGIGFGVGQACKKALEAQRRTIGEARHELLGAIVYLAGTVIYLDEVLSKTDKT